MPSWIGPKIAILGGKIVKILWKNRKKWEKYLYYPYLLIYWYNILHSGSSYMYIKSRYKLWFETEWVQKIWGKIFKFRAWLFKFHNNTPLFLNTN